MAKRPPAPPRHLREPGRDLWRTVVTDFVLQEHHLRVLLAACEARDRAASCREAIDSEGATVTDRWGQTKSHPLLAAERDSRAAFLAALRDLGLDIVPAGKPGRPPGR